MTSTGNQQPIQLLAQLGVPRIGVKVGSRWAPLILIALMAIGFLAYTVTEDKKGIAEEFANVCARTPGVAATKAKAYEEQRNWTKRRLDRRVEEGKAQLDKDPYNQRKKDALSNAERSLHEHLRNPPPMFKSDLLQECRAYPSPSLETVSPGESIDAAKAAFRKTIMTRMEALPTLKQMLGEFPDDIVHLGGLQQILLQARAFAKTYFANLTVAFKQYAGSVAKVIGIAFVLSILPGLAGLIYRRAFGRWFIVSFVVLVALMGAIDAERAVAKDYLYASEAATLFALIVSQTIILLLSHRLRRYTSTTSKFIPSGIFNKLLAVILIAIAAMIGLFDVGNEVWAYAAPDDWFLRMLYKWEFILIILPLVYTLLRQSDLWTPRVPKNIVVCLDGTNNTPDQLELGRVAHTNVYKLFRLLKSDTPPRSFPEGAFGASLCKSYQDKQIGFYYVGVGNQFENDPIGQILGQAMGLGASGLVDRAYLDVMRVYQPGDKVYIFGFSRGAAIARLLARALDQRGNPQSVWTIRLFGRHWTIWKSKPAFGEVGRIPIAVLGCWDTVGAFGLAKKVAGIDFQKIDLFKDLSIPNNVEQAYHMLALDEERDSFVPTLMDPDPIKPGRIVEVWFSGDHANVGGGWATQKLSDISLAFLLGHVSSGYTDDPTQPSGDETWGLCLDAVNVATLPDEHPARLQPNAVDADHRGQLRQWSSMLYNYAPRKLPVHAVISDKVFERMTQSEPVYAPQSLFDLNEELDKKRSAVGAAIKRLRETDSLQEDELERIFNFMKKLQLTRWSVHLRNLRQHNAAPDPSEELKLRRDGKIPLPGMLVPVPAG